MTSPSTGHLTTINGVAYVNRAGLCEMTGLSLESINHLCAPSRRAASGCPEPIKIGRVLWYPLEEARSWVEQLNRLQRQDRPATTADPDELITVEQFRTEIMRPVISDNTMRSYIRKSRLAWRRGQDGILPRPDTEVPARHGTSPRWRRGRALASQENRPGKPTTGRPAEVDRTPQPAPPIDDPDELIGETRFRTEISRPPLSQDAWYRLIDQSKDAWRRSEDGILLRPDAEHTHAGHTNYKWRAGRAAAWQNARARAAQQHTEKVN